MWTIKLKDGLEIKDVCYVATDEEKDILEYKTIYGVWIETKLSLCSMIKHVDGDTLYESKESLKEIEEHIKSIQVNEANFKHIAETGNINGTLLSELRREMKYYAKIKVNEVLDKLIEDAEKLSVNTHNINNVLVINKESILKLKS